MNKDARLAQNCDQEPPRLGYKLPLEVFGGFRLGWEKETD